MVAGHFKPGHFNPKLKLLNSSSRGLKEFYNWSVEMFMIEKSGVEKLRVEMTDHPTK